MAPPFDFQVHRPVKGGAEHEMTEDPYIVLGSADGDVYLRYGKFWDAGGNEVSVDDLSDQKLTQVDGLTDEALASVGFQDWQRSTPAKPAVAAIPAVEGHREPAPVKVPAKAK